MSHALIVSNTVYFVFLFLPFSVSVSPALHRQTHTHTHKYIASLFLEKLLNQVFNILLGMSYASVTICI